MEVGVAPDTSWLTKNLGFDVWPYSQKAFTKSISKVWIAALVSTLPIVSVATFFSEAIYLPSDLVIEILTAISSVAWSIFLYKAMALRARELGRNPSIAWLVFTPYLGFLFVIAYTVLADRDPNTPQFPHLKKSSLVLMFLYLFITGTGGFGLMWAWYYQSIAWGVFGGFFCGVLIAILGSFSLSQELVVKDPTMISKLNHRLEMLSVVFLFVLPLIGYIMWINHLLPTE